jgi:hypothetical protein
MQFGITKLQQSFKTFHIITVFLFFLSDPYRIGQYDTSFLFAFIIFKKQILNSFGQSGKPGNIFHQGLFYVMFSEWQNKFGQT